MKATGIVRRIDDLGRVVIQKKSAVRYVFVKVIHWKFSWIVMEKLSLKIFANWRTWWFCQRICRIPVWEYRTCNDDFWPGYHYHGGRRLQERIFGQAGGSTVGRLYGKQEDHSETNNGSYELSKDHDETLSSFVIAPIISGGDPIGTVILFNKDESVKMSQMEVKMSETAAGFLGKQMEQ